MVIKLYDETYYLAQDPDVAEAAATGLFRNGWQHFFKYGRFEGRKTATLVDETFI